MLCEDFSKRKKPSHMMTLESRNVYFLTMNLSGGVCLV